MSQKCSRLSVRRLQGAKLLAQGHTHRQVAEQLGVSERTVNRWSVAPNVREAVIAEVAPEESPELKYSRFVKQGLPASLGAVLSVLRDPDSKTTDKLKAASLLESWHRMSMASSSEYISAADARELISNLLECIHRHVPDKATRAAIARDFKQITTSQQ